MTRRKDKVIAYFQDNPHACLSIDDICRLWGGTSQSVRQMMWELRRSGRMPLSAVFVYRLHERARKDLGDKP